MPDTPPPSALPPAIPASPPDSDAPLLAVYHTVLAGTIVRRGVEGSPDSRPVNRHSLTLVGSRLEKGRWFREFQDLVVDPATLRLWRNERTVPLEEVRAAHAKLRRSHPIDAGLASPLLSDSTPTGEDPGLTLGKGPHDRFPLSLSHAYLPTIVPTLTRALVPAPASQVAFALGVGRIAATFDVAPVSADAFERVYTVTAKPQEHATRTDEAALTLAFSGEWTLAFRDDPRMPARANGKFSIRARAVGLRKGRPIDLLAAEDDLAFSWRRVPVNVTPTLVVFAGWKYDLP